MKDAIIIGSFLLVIYQGPTLLLRIRKGILYALERRAARG